MNLDHVALQVTNPKEAAEWYSKNFLGEIIYADDSWSFVKLGNIKIAFVIKTQHPPHIAFEVQEFDPSDKVKEHRDGSRSIYKRDPWGNVIEYIMYSGDEGESDGDKRKGLWRGVWGKVQNWRSCNVDRCFRFGSSIREKRKDKLWYLNCKESKISWWKRSLFC